MLIISLDQSNIVSKKIIYIRNESNFFTINYINEIIELNSFLVSSA